ncbi:MAG: hypothetical protein RML36_07175 [Anaerolineae bacterium]|nr:hypothetical protein [Anaerolineae bacterium]
MTPYVMVEMEVQDWVLRRQRGFAYTERFVPCRFRTAKRPLP